MVVYGKRNYGSAMSRAGAATVIQRAWRARKARQNSKAVIVSRWPRAPLATRGFYGPQRRSPEEQKVIDVIENTYNFNISSTVIGLNFVATGSDFTNRIGRKITMTSIQCRGMICPTDTTTISSQPRMLIVYDTQPNGALPTITEVLQASTSSSMLNLNNRDRFRVLYDKQVVVGGVSNTTDQSFALTPSCHNIKMYKKLNLPVIFDGTGATIADIQTGSVVALFISTSGVSDGASFTGSFRIRFTDA